MNGRRVSNVKPYCPECGSKDIAEMLWGMPVYDEKLIHGLEEGRIVLGGCCVTGDDPDWHCNDCGCEFGAMPIDVLDDSIESI